MIPDKRSFSAERPTLRLEAYRKISAWVYALFQSWKGRRQAVMTQVAAPSQQRGRRIWFHAASVGELESLWSVIESFSGPDEDVELIVSIFSDSARPALDRLVVQLQRAGVRLIAAGFAPPEGSWGEWLGKYRPAAFVTAKYEAWPELWCSLSLLGVPLCIVGARSRSSLLWAKRICKALGVALPRLVLLVTAQEDEAPLAQDFPSSAIRSVGDPRWDRVFERVKIGSARAQELTRGLASLPRPWGVFGSAWMEDLVFWGSRLKESSGTLWVVPHRVDRESVAEIEVYLKGLGIRTVRSTSPEIGKLGSGQVTDPPRCILVDESGFLSELYSAADWAFVGGGFGSGVHSTIEPAIHGIPIAAGPNRSEAFSEIAMLRATGQLQIMHTSEELEAWAARVGQSGSADLDGWRARWKMQAIERAGATERVRNQVIVYSSS